MSTMNRRRGGWLAKAEGDNWEKQLEDTHALYALAGIALIEKKPVPTAPAPSARLRKGPPLRIMAERTGYDYHGVLGCAPEPGQAIAMEAKSTSKPAASLEVGLYTKQEARDSGRKSAGAGLKWHQLEALDRVLRFNGLPVVVWANGITHPKGKRLILLPDEIRSLYLRAARERSKPMHKASIRVSVEKFVEFEPAALYRPQEDGGSMLGVAEDWLAPLVQWMTAKKGDRRG